MGAGTCDCRFDLLVPESASAPFWRSSNLDVGGNAGNSCGGAISWWGEEGSNRTRSVAADDSVGSASEVALEFGLAAQCGRSNVSAVSESHTNDTTDFFRIDDLRAGGNEPMLGCTIAVYPVFLGFTPSAAGRETG